MHNKFIQMALVVISLLSMLIPVHANNLSKFLSTETTIKPIKRVEPKYPVNAARSRREGWVILSFVINKEGGVEDIKEVSDSGSKDFVKSAIQALKKWKYQPSIENGKPINQNVKTLKMRFYMAGGPTVGVSKKFWRKYEKAVNALSDKDDETFNELITSLKKNKKMHLSENNYLHLLLSEYAKSNNDKQKQLYHLGLVTNSIERLSKEEDRLSVLFEVFNLQAELNQFNATFDTYQQLLKLPEFEPYEAQFAGLMKNIDALIESDKNIIQPARIDQGSWRTELARNSFSITDIVGELKNLHINCSNKSHEYTIETDNTWTIPSTWKNCEVRIYGENNTVFNLVEQPFSDKNNID